MIRSAAWMKPLAAIAAFFLCTAAIAQVTPMKSFSYMTQGARCNGADQLLVLDGSGNTFAPPADPGAGIFPSGTFHVRKVCVTHWINGNQANAYIVAGHSGPNGDHVTPMPGGSATACTEYPADAPVLFQPGEYFDVHASCMSGWHWATLHIWFTQ